MRKYLLVLLLSFSCAFSWAQVQPVLTDTTKHVPPANAGGIQDFYNRKDSVKKFYAKDIRFANASQFEQDTIAFTRLDTVINRFQNYSPFYHNNNYYMNNGNLGLPSHNLFPQFTVNSVEFRNGQNAYSLYEIKPEHVQYYRVYAPYTELYWVSAFGKESMFYFIHTQNIKPNFNVGIKYFTLGSEGYYPKQRPKDSYLTGWSWYQSKSLKYNLVSNISTFGFKAQENGGLTNDSIFTVPTVVSHQFEGVYLNNAKNTWKNFSWFLKQTYIIGKRDTNARYQNKLFKSPYSRVSHEFLYDQKSYTYDQAYASGDPLRPTQYYQYNYYDTLKTNDNISQKLLRNDLDLALYGRGGLNKFNVNAGVRFDYLTYKQSIVFHDTSSVVPTDRSFNNFILKGKIGIALSNTIGLVANGEYNLAGYNFSDYLLNAVVTVDLGQNAGKVLLKALSQNAEPGYLFTKYASNHHFWDNSFSKINTNQLGVYYSNERTKTALSGEYFLTTNYTYLRKDPIGIIPIQAPNSVHLFRVQLDQEVLFGKFGWLSHYVFQKNNSSFISTPAFYTYQSIFYQNKVFKALGFQVGLDARYYTTYKAYSYAPELGQYYVNSSTIQVGNYPILDAFLTANLRRARFLVKYDYLNQGLGRKGYYTVDKYAMPDQNLKFGVSWRFYD
ncbi:putative porin [Solitalea koreensis]|uniref:Porin n=1 Tax=Solitalea koreensis TaxID=543615 RepID=A0A521AH06_9SPHI|nr:putative porin [Solitalea koreensis]SMO34107.1 Putative porin [Solitalea koreensis]